MDKKAIFDTTLSTIITLMEDLSPNKIDCHFRIEELADSKQEIVFTLKSKKSAGFIFAFVGHGIIENSDLENIVLISNLFAIILRPNIESDLEVKLTAGRNDEFIKNIDSEILNIFWEKIDSLMCNSKSFKYIKFDYEQIYKHSTTVENYLNDKLKEKLFESAKSNEDLWVDYEEYGYYEEYVCTYAEQKAMVYINTIEIEEIEEMGMLEREYNSTSIELSIGEHLKLVNCEISNLLELEDKIKDAKKTVIDFTNQLVMSDEIDVYVKSKCSCVYKQHRLVKINAQVPIVADRKLAYKEIFLLYCRECDVYYASKAEMLKLKKLGRIACQVMDYKDYHHSIFHGHNNQLQERSPLHLYGYNVNQKENLSSKERREILYMIIDHNILSLDETISYIEYFINKNGQKERNHLALEKWIDDLNFLKRFDVLDTNKRVRSITEY